MIGELFNTTELYDTVELTSSLLLTIVVTEIRSGRIDSSTLLARKRPTNPNNIIKVRRNINTIRVN